MDVADAINIMLYASPRPDSQPGCAVWDLYRAEDADAIRGFLRRRFSTTHKFTDPIHSQHFYLDASLRRELWEEEKVVGWRVYQYPVSFMVERCGNGKESEGERSIESRRGVLFWSRSYVDRRLHIPGAGSVHPGRLCPSSM
jgi:hypothetical protein